MIAVEVLKAFIKDIVIPYFVPLIGLLLALIGVIIPFLERRSSKRELVCAIIKSIPERQGREVTVRVTNTGHTQLVPSDQSRIRFFFGKSAVIYQVGAVSGIKTSNLVRENKHVLVTPPFLNPKDSFSFQVHLQSHHLFKATSQIEGISRIWWEHSVTWRKRIINQDLLLVVYDLFLVGFLFALPWQATVFRAIAPFAWILKTQFYPLLLLLCLGFLAISLWLYLLRVVRKSEKSLRLVVKRTSHP